MTTESEAEIPDMGDLEQREDELERACRSFIEGDLEDCARALEQLQPDMGVELYIAARRMQGKLT